jgi:hypothetical protein
MRLEITTHRLLFKSTTHHALQIKGEIVRDVSISVLLSLSLGIGVLQQDLLREDAYTVREGQIGHEELQLSQD